MHFRSLVNSVQMYGIERSVISQGLLTDSQLMENAGRAVVEAISKRWDGLDGLRAIVACGKGNNGGDGLVVARQLTSLGADVRVILLAGKRHFGEFALEQLRMIEDLGVNVHVWSTDGEINHDVFCKVDLVVDALLGIGQSGAPREELVRLIEIINISDRPIVAIDIPTGVVAGTGATPGACVNATSTITFGLPKVGHMFYPGRSKCGELDIYDIGFPKELLDTTVGEAELLDAVNLQSVLPVRAGDVHKGKCGSVVVIAGSVGMTGAAVLASESAMRVGVGKVCLGVPRSVNDIVEGMLAEVITMPLPEIRRSRCLSLRSLGIIREILCAADVLALGPGIGRHSETLELVRRLIVRCEIPLVLDADGLQACVGHLELLSRRKGDIVLTPHIGEFKRLIGRENPFVGSEVLSVARDFAIKHGVILLLKGAPTVIALPHGKLMVNPTGNAGMATAGSGDVLTGVVAGFISQGVDLDEAVQLGAFVHGGAGDKARDLLGEWGMTASDIVEQLPTTIMELAKVK